MEAKERKRKSITVEMLKLRLEKYRKIKDFGSRYPSHLPPFPPHPSPHPFPLPLPLPPPPPPHSSPYFKSLLFVVLAKINTLFSGGPT
jgi:hypothetical protein